MTNPKKNLTERFQRRLKKIQSVQARYQSHRTRWERIADRVAAWCGSQRFLGINLIVFAAWVLWNTKIIPAIDPFDPFPFNLLTMVVSLEAIVLSIFVLMSQNRQAHIAELREEEDLQIDMISEAEITKIIHLLAGLYRGLKVPTENDPELREMMKPTDREVIEKQLEEQLKEE